MIKYADLDHDSSIAGFETTADSITIYFKDNSVYLYNYQVTGSHHIIQMNLLAHRGEGLNSYIMKYVKTKFARKIR